MSPTYKKILVLSCISLVLCLLNIQPGHNWGGDFSMYLAQAKHLLQGTLDDLYVANKFAMEQSDLPMGPGLYPMGYPVVLAPLYYVFGLNFVVLKIFNALFFVGSIPLVYTLLRSVAFEKKLAFYSTTLFAINYQLVYMSDSLGSDFQAMFLGFLALYLMLRTRDYNSFQNAMLLGFIVFMTFITRTAGLVLIPTLMVFQFCKYLKTKHFNLGKVLSPYLVFTVCYLLYGQVVESIDSKYLALIDNVTLESIGWNVVGYGEFIMEFLISTKFIPFPLTLLAALIFFPIFALGIKSIIKLDNLFLLCYCAALLVLYIVYPFTSIRFIIPISAFVIYAFLNGVKIVGDNFSKKLNIDLGNWIIYALIIVGLLQSMVAIVVQQKKGTNESLSLEMQSIYAYINEEIADDKIFVFHKPRVLRLFTNNNGYMLTDLSSSKIQQADHLLVSKDRVSYDGFEIQKSWENFQLMKRSE